MTASLIGGLATAPDHAEQVLVCEPDADRRQQLQNQFGVRTSADNTDALTQDILVLATKPQQLQSVCRQLAAEIKTGPSSNEPLFISIAAGVHSKDIDRWLGANRAVIRCMPNTPALVQCGATGLYANASTSASQKQNAETILQAVGITLWVDDEAQLDAVTALSGSGPAYYFLMMEAMQAAAEQLGLDPGTAMKLSIQTALGAARMASENDIHPGILRQRVTSKGGTTEQALKSFEQAGFQQQVLNAMKAAHQRSQSLAQELAQDQP